VDVSVVIRWVCERVCGCGCVSRHECERVRRFVRIVRRVCERCCVCWMLCVLVLSPNVSVREFVGVDVF